MNIRPADIIEAVIDEPATGELAERVDAFTMTRAGDATVLLDYGAAGRFRLDVTEV